MQESSPDMMEFDGRGEGEVVEVEDSDSFVRRDFYSA